MSDNTQGKAPAVEGLESPAGKLVSIGEVPDDIVMADPLYQRGLADATRMLADQKKAQTEPVAVVGFDTTAWRSLVDSLRVLPDGTRLYATPPDAAAIIERLTQERDAAWDNGHTAGREKSPTYAENQALRDEVERLTAALGKAREGLKDAADSLWNYSTNKAARKAEEDLAAIDEALGEKGAAA